MADDAVFLVLVCVLAAAVTLAVSRWGLAPVVTPPPSDE
jgi:hypothetical protein